ncbi:hypothetical protein ACHAWO_002132 [Cyclotella atomus]|uniref:Uncharacterized protein n=1 Tax=Cyclotella atomus TaxID=382360 RepID=A0ABD3QPF9_9STRA
MVVPRKPHEKGNEYHTICDGDEGRPILWRMELVEGKDRPKKGSAWAFPCGPDKGGHHQDTGPDATNDPSPSTGRRKYWPKYVPGPHIIDHFKDKELGTTETYKQTLDGEEFFVHCYRDDKYVCKMMSCHGLLDKVADHKTARHVNGAWKSFHYAKPFSRQNRPKHWVDDHNNRRHDPISLDDTWKTKHWPIVNLLSLCL